MTTLYSHGHHPHPPPLDQPTPQSPPFYMSANHAASSNNTTTKFHSSVAAGVSPPHSSPLTTSFSNNNSRQQPIATTTNNTLLTPTSSAAGTVPPTTSHEDTDGDTNMEDDDDKSHKRRRMSSPYDRNAPTTAPSLRHRNTVSGPQGYMPDASPPIPSEHEVLSQPDVSTYYLVCPKPHEPSYPDLTGNLLTLYNLKPIADSVARFNPETGVKNKLRKSYKGFINDLPGKNIVVTKASQTEPNSGDGPGDGNKMDLLGTLLMWPEEEWHNQNVHGKELSKGLDMSKLRKGLNMTKGDIPGFDASILGLEEELRRKTPHAATTPAVAVGTPHVNGSTPGGASSAGGDDARPKRKRRRRYDDTSYEGYGGEFEGEEDAPVNNGSGGNGPGGGMVGSGSWNEEKKKKKRKKNPDMNSPSAGGVGVSSGMNMSHHAHHGGGITVHSGSYGR